MVKLPNVARLLLCPLLQGFPCAHYGQVAIVSSLNVTLVPNLSKLPLCQLWPSFHCVQCFKVAQVSNIAKLPLFQCDEVAQCPKVDLVTTVTRFPTLAKLPLCQVSKLP